MELMVVYSYRFGAFDVFDSGLNFHFFTLIFIPVIDLGLDLQ